MSIRVQVSGARNQFRQFRWNAAAGRWADVVAPVVQERLKQEAPVGKGPTAGRLRDSIRHERHVGTGNAQLVFTADTPYARFVLHGTGPHVIRPRTARVLRWQGPAGPRFAQVVHHPGTRANPFPERAVRPLMPLIQARFTEIVSAKLRG